MAGWSPENTNLGSIWYFLKEGCQVALTYVPPLLCAVSLYTMQSQSSSAPDLAGRDKILDEDGLTWRAVRTRVNFLPNYGNIDQTDINGGYYLMRQEGNSS